MNQLLSIVIVEYNSINEIMNCVDSIRTHIHIPHEIIISSNSCYDKDKQKDILSRNTSLRWSFNEKNGGFAYAMNQGLRIAKGDYLVIMNSDCTISCNLNSMLDFLNKHKNIGAIAPQIIDSEGNIQDTARPYVSLPSFVYRQLKRIITKKESILNSTFDYQKIQTVDWVIGAFIMVSREAYTLTNGLDEQFFMYAEDLDWCTRIRKAALEVVYYPKICITYKGTRRARSNGKYAKIFLNSHLLYWRKYGFIFGYPKRKEIIFY